MVPLERKGKGVTQRRLDAMTDGFHKGTCNAFQDVRCINLDAPPEDKEPQTLEDVSSHDNDEWDLWASSDWA